MYRHADEGGRMQACAPREPQRDVAGPGRSGSVTSSRHEQLRCATAEVHRCLEGRLQRAGYFASQAGYRRYLGAVAPLYAMLEATLEIAGAHRLVPDWPRRRKSDLILAELRADGCADGAAGRLCPPVAARLDTMAAWGAGDVLGTLYVLEGATLGGAVLARRMRLRGAAGSGTRCLLDPYGSECGAMWRTFLERLEAADLTHEDEAALGTRAGATFALFSAATERPAHAGPAA